jgi:hypothetical protein
MPHSYVWADAVYECRGYPARVVISKRSPEETGRILQHVYGHGGADMDDSAGGPYIHRFVPPPAYQQKEAFRHRLMDWIMSLTTLECYILATACVLSASILFFTVVWAWVMF